MRRATTIAIAVCIASTPACGTTTSATTTSATTRLVSVDGVQLRVPANWPVIDGAHAHFGCRSTFADQATKVFVGPSSFDAPQGCAFDTAHPPPADGVWINPLGSSSQPPSTAQKTLPTGQAVYLISNPREGEVDVWLHGVLIAIGVGPNPSVERSILNSITYRVGAPDTALLGRCPPASGAPRMPTPVTVTREITLRGDAGVLDAAPSGVRPRVPPSRVWRNLSEMFNLAAFTGHLDWSISYGVQRGAPDIPVWVIQAQGSPTPYGPCGITLSAVYDANNGKSLGVSTTE